VLAGSSVGWAIALLCACVSLAGSGCRSKKDISHDASVGESSARDSGDNVDANLPETVVIVLEAGADPGRPAPPVSTSGSRYVTLLSGLPAPCQDTSKHLGLVTFSQSGDNVVITSSKTKARARCVPKDPNTLMCDWIGIDGKPSVQEKPVTYGPKKAIGGSFDKTHRFTCKPQR
jgi:hypothetical protein